MGKINHDNLRVWLVINSLPPRFSGAAINDVRIAPYLNKLGLTVTFITRRYGKKAELEDLDGIKVHRIGQMASPIANLRWIVGGIKLLILTKERPEIIRFRGYSLPFSVLIFVSKLLFPKIKIIVQSACLGEDDPDTVARKRFGRFQKTQMLKSDAVFAMNPVIAEKYACNGYNTCRIYPVRNIVDVNNFTVLNREEKELSKRKLGLPDGLIIVTLGILDSRKGQALITQSFCKHLEQHYSNKIFLVHIGPTADDLKHLSRLDRLSATRDEEWRVRDIATIAGLESQVILVGNKDNPSEYLAASDIFVHCSLFEGEANVVNEALASGLSVILPDSNVYISQVPENCALRFRVGDSDDLEKQLSKVIGDELLRKRLGVNARNHILKTRTAENVAEHYAGLFKKVCL